MENTPADLRPLVVAVAALSLLGCAVPDPQRTYAAKAGDAKLIFRSVDMPMDVDFSVSANPQPCQGFERVGVVRDSGRGVLLPWIANMSEKLNRVPTRLDAMAPAGAALQIKGYGNWVNPGATRGSCGPLVAKFIAQSDATYLVEFVWEGTSACSMRVFDASRPEGPRPITFERNVCPR